MSKKIIASLSGLGTAALVTAGIIFSQSSTPKETPKEDPKIKEKREKIEKRNSITAELIKWQKSSQDCDKNCKKTKFPNPGDDSKWEMLWKKEKDRMDKDRTVLHNPELENAEKFRDWCYLKLKEDRSYNQFKILFSEAAKEFHGGYKACANKDN